VSSDVQVFLECINIDVLIHVTDQGADITRIPVETIDIIGIKETKNHVIINITEIADKIK